MKVGRLIMSGLLVLNLTACIKQETVVFVEPVANPRVVERILDPEKVPPRRMHFDDFTKTGTEGSEAEEALLFEGLGEVPVADAVNGGGQLEPVTAFVGFEDQSLSRDGSDVVEVFLQEVKRHPFINEHRYMLVAQSTEAEMASRMNSEIISALMSEGVASDQITAFTSDKNGTTAQGQGVKLLAIDVSDDPARYLN